MRRRLATVATAGEWQCKLRAFGGSQLRMGPTFFQMFLVNSSVNHTLLMSHAVAMVTSGVGDCLSVCLFAL